MKAVVAWSLGVVLLAAAVPAHADEGEPAAAPKLRGAVVLPPVVVTGRRLPVASASIMRVQPALTLTELRISLVDRLEKVLTGPNF